MSFQSASGGSADAALAKFANDVRAGAKLAVDAAAITLKAEIQIQLSKPGTGRYYAKAALTARVGVTGSITPTQHQQYIKRRQKNRRLNATRRAYARALNSGAIAFEDVTRRDVLTGLHRASAPGESPAPDTGTLKRSAFIERTEKGSRVGVAVAYATALEFGTVRAGKDRNITILPRPFMRPALAAVKSNLGDVFVSRIKREVHGNR